MPTTLILASLAIFIGFIALIYSANLFISSAASMANHWGMSKLKIGLTIVAFGTSAPEIMVSFFASTNGSVELAVGSALGSNLANIGMALGITALIIAMPVKAAMIKSELPILMAVTLIAGLTLYDGHLSIIDSVILLSSLSAFMIFLFKKQSSAPHQDDDDDDDASELIQHSQAKATVYLIVGLTILLASANLLVWGAKEIALFLGISELIIGLTVVAIGTSLPELAASVTSALKGHHDIAFGSIIGSNIFNLLVVMAVPGLVASTDLSPNVFQRDYLAMILISSLFAAMMIYCVIRKRLFSRFMGLLLLLSYASYYAVLYQQL